MTATCKTSQEGFEITVTLTPPVATYVCALLFQAAIHAFILM